MCGARRSGISAVPATRSCARGSQCPFSRRGMTARVPMASVHRCAPAVRCQPNRARGRKMIANMLARFCNESQAEAALLRLGEPDLAAALRRRAEAQGIALGAYTALAVRHYMDAAP